MSTTYNVSVIVINYNGEKYVDCLFDSLTKLKHNDFTYEVVVVDNASTDDSLAYLKSKHYEEHMNLTIAESKDNLGFAGGNNFGVKHASGEYIVFLNNDTAVDALWLEELYHFIKTQKNCVIANSKLLFYYDYVRFTFQTQDKIELNRQISINETEHYADGKFMKNCLCEEKKLVCFGHTEMMLPLLGKTGRHEYIFQAQHWNHKTDAIIIGGNEYKQQEDGCVHVVLEADDVEKNRITLVQNAGSGINEVYNGFDIGFCEEDGEKFCKPYEINNGCGAAIIMKKADFTACGGFDEQFFMYYEDTDLSYRMKAKGGKIMFCPTSIVRHIHTGSSTEWSPFFTYHVYRNKLLFLYKNISKKQFYIYYCRQYFEGIRYRDAQKKRGCKDAYRIAVKKQEDIHY